MPKITINTTKSEQDILEALADIRDESVLPAPAPEGILEP
jgi:hypothetical protein